MDFETELSNNSKNDLSIQMLNLFAESEFLDLDTNTTKSMVYIIFGLKYILNFL